MGAAVEAVSVTVMVLPRPLEAPVGATRVLFASGYGNGVSEGVPEVVSTGLTMELEGAVGPVVGATTVLFGDG